jgi:hypothetical protein
MEFHDDLLELSELITHLHPPGEQASLRRAVSTAYYALFHLIHDATENWAQPELRSYLARCFEHGKMKTAYEKVAGKNYVTRPEREAVANQLRVVAMNFTLARQHRNDADCNNSRVWTLVEVQRQINAVREAFDSWRQIRDESEAQRYLVGLLGPKETGAAELK